MIAISLFELKLNKQENFLWLLSWTFALMSLCFIFFEIAGWQCNLFGLFLFFILGGVLLDFFICKWKHPFNKKEPEPKENSPVNNFITRVEYNYQCFDASWRNFLLFLILLLHGIVSILIFHYLSKNHILFKKSNISIDNTVTCFAVFIPYLFHRAYYFASRVPELKKSVYVYYENKNETRINISLVSLIGQKISDPENIPREFEGWLFNTRVVFTDKEIQAINIVRGVPCINQSWSYRQLLDIIFYQKNQSEDEENFYKKEWINEVKLFSGNDYLVRTCWEVKIDTGSTGSGIPFNPYRITDFSTREFNEDKIKVNGLLTIERTL